MKTTSPKWPSSAFGRVIPRGASGARRTAYLLQGCYHHLRNELRLRRNKAKELSVEDIENAGGRFVEDAVLVDPCSLEEQVEARQLLTAVRAAGLTNKEEIVLSLSLDGWTVREIGERLGVSHCPDCQAQEQHTIQVRRRSWKGGDRLMARLKQGRDGNPGVRLPHGLVITCRREDAPARL